MELSNGLLLAWPYHLLPSMPPMCSQTGCHLFTPTALNFSSHNFFMSPIFNVMFLCETRYFGCSQMFSMGFKSVVKGKMEWCVHNMNISGPRINLHNCGFNISTEYRTFCSWSQLIISLFSIPSMELFYIIIWCTVDHS
jgi:hypothetical protein